MITAVVQFPIRQPVTREKARELFSATAARYREVPGLIRKYYLLSEDHGSVGGVYLWKSRSDAERMYNEEWRGFIKERYSAEPSVTYFDSPVIVDNAAGVIEEG
jgi:hypothetical protein